MNDANLSVTITVPQSPEDATAAINNVRGWWVGKIDGNTTRLGDVFTYRYADVHYSRQEIVEMVPGKRVAWRVLESDLGFLADRSEWTGTTISFDVARHGDGARIVFTHVGLKPDVECYDTCSDAWTSLIAGSLKQLIETGKAEELVL